MKLKAVMISLVLGAGHGGVSAQQVDQPRERLPAHNPEFSAPRIGDPASAGRQRIETQRAVPADSVADDLQRIVVLCATDASSKAFDTAWSDYIRSHYRRGVDLEALIEDVLQRAEAHRATAGRSNRDPGRDLESTTTRKRMHDTAMAVIRKIG